MVSSRKPYIIVIKTGLKYESRKRLAKSKINITPRSHYIDAYLHVTINDSTKQELKVKAATARSKVKSLLYHDVSPQTNFSTKYQLSPPYFSTFARSSQGHTMTLHTFCP